MTGRFWLDWAIMAASLFNTVLLLWLGLTVLLNANRREWSVWLMGGGLLAGALFFISHSAILGQELAMNLDGLNFWWRVGWFPVTVSPFAWYGAVLWFGGFWATQPSLVRHRHRIWLPLMAGWLVGLLTLLLVANPIPSYAQLVQPTVRGAWSVANLPLWLLLFPLWMVTCILLSLDALPKPAPLSTQPHAQEDANLHLARLRARPWLLGTAGALLAVSLVVTYFIGSIVVTVAEGGLSAVRVETVACYDLVLSLLIALSSLLLGQAIVAYEIFTGRVLPRRSFVRHWRNAIVLAAGFALAVGWSIAANLRPIYSLLLATLLLTLFYALYGWRSFREREQFVARLRPFMQSQELAPAVMVSETTAGATGATASALLAALCQDVLGTAHAQLVPLGRMAPLVTTALRYPPPSASSPLTSTPSLPRDLEAGMTRLTAAFAPYGWAISLWDERGRVGVLLVGEKLDGGLYSQEEMETAQAAGERIVQLLAGEQMVRRLMELQRKRTAEQRVMDLRTRRTLHDDILPALHLAVLQLGRADRQEAAVAEALGTLAEAHTSIAALLTASQPAPARAADPCELVSALRALVAHEFPHSFEEVRWQGWLAQERPLYVNDLLGEVMVGAAREAIRNAATHGRGGQTHRPLHVEIGLCVTKEQAAQEAQKEEEEEAGEIMLTIQDNGVGLGVAQRSRADSKSGSGNGLALHSTLLAMVGGYLAVESPTNGGAIVRIGVGRSDATLL